jgi:hypothetical protein
VSDAVTGAGEEDLQREWVEKLKSTTLDDRIFVLTPQARVLELPQSAPRRSTSPTTCTARSATAAAAPRSTA